MKSITKNILVVALAALSAVAITSKAADIQVFSNSQGWVNNTGNANGAWNGNNTFTGNSNYSRYNSWANFVLPTFVDPIISVSLSGLLRPWEVSSNETIGVFDVTTSFEALDTHTGGIDAYFDFSNGKQYGSISGYDGTYSVVLIPDAVTDIFASSGSNFLIGFTNLTQNIMPANAGSTGIYTNGLTGGMPTLTITTGTSIPEPATSALLGLGLLGFAASRRKPAKN